GALRFHRRRWSSLQRNSPLGRARQTWAQGGDHSATNISLRCRSHNAYEAERDYGAHFIERKRQQRTSAVVREPVARYRRRAANPSPRMLREPVAGYQPYTQEPTPALALRLAA